jgi:hypothetical protein
MAVGVIPVVVGDVEVLVETVPVAGTEPTSRISDAVDGVTDVFSRLQQVILELASSTAATIGAAAERGARPDRLEVEFGLKISAKGNVVVAGASAEATVNVRLSYEAAPSGPR